MHVDAHVQQMMSNSSMLRTTYGQAIRDSFVRPCGSSSNCLRFVIGTRRMCSTPANQPSTLLVSRFDTATEHEV